MVLSKITKPMYAISMKINFASIVHLLHEAAHGSLATHSTQIPGYPFASAVPFALDEQHRPFFLISGLAEHTKNLITDCRASFLVQSSSGQKVLASERVTLVGDAKPFEPSPALRARSLRYQPESGQYLGFGDFTFFRLSPKSVRYIAGFGQMGWVDEAEWANSMILPLADEEGLVKDLINVQPSGVRLLGVDCYGFDVERAGRRERQRFSNEALSVDKIGETVRRFLSAM